MVNRCFAPNCKNSRQKCPRMTFVRFPKDQERCNLWIHYSSRTDLRGLKAEYLYRTALMCEKHFEDSQWMNKNQKFLGLIHTGIPTIFDIPNPPPRILSTQKLSTRQATDEKSNKPIKEEQEDNDELDELLQQNGVLHEHCYALLNSYERSTDLPEETEPSLAEESEFSTGVYKNLIAELSLSSAEDFVDRIELINRLLDAWAAGWTVRVTFINSNGCSRTVVSEAWTKAVDDFGQRLNQGEHCESRSIPSHDTRRLTIFSEHDNGKDESGRISSENDVDMSLDINCDVITSEEDFEYSTGCVGNTRDEELEKFEQTCVEFGNCIRDLLQRHDCNSSMKDDDVIELIRVVRRKFAAMEIQLKKESSEAVSGLQIFSDGVRGKENAPKPSVVKLSTNFCNNFENRQIHSPKKLAKDNSIKGSSDKVSAPCAARASSCNLQKTNQECDGIQLDTEGKQNEYIKDDMEKEKNVSQTLHELGSVIFRCVDCGKIFRDKKSCAVHAAAGCKHSVRDHGQTDRKNPSQGLLYECPFCHKILPFFSKLLQHLPIHTKPFMCSLCKQRFPEENLLEDHKTTCTADSIESTDYAVDDDNAPSTCSSEPFLCSCCGKQFVRRSSLYYHMRRHSGNPNLMCSFCGKLFYDNAVLIQHLRIHTGDRPYLCPHCPLKFISVGMLQRHLRVHTGERPYTCDICQRSFSQSNSMKAHRLTHSTNRSFTCVHCDKTFRKQGSLVMHMKLHNNESGFVQKPFSCKFCGKVCSSRTRLRLHDAVHTGKRPQKTQECSECKRKFDTYRGLQRHVGAVHCGKTPGKAIICGVCNKRFFTSEGLLKHEQLQHKNKSSGASIRAASSSLLALSAQNSMPSRDGTTENMESSGR